MSAERKFAERVAREAGEELLRLYLPSGQEEIGVKGRPRDLVTRADGASERLILSALSKEFPDDAVIAEETSPETVREGRVWVIDPLDGTVHYAHGIPLFSVSIGFMVDGVPVAGAIHAPMLRETWSAALGEGATLNGEPVSVSPATDLSRAVLGTGFAYRRNEVAENNIDNVRRMILEARGLRRLGSAAVDLAFVATGRYDGFWELWLSPWDVCAGIVLVQEAGGVVSGIGEGEDPLFGGSILACPPGLHGVLRERLSGVPPGG
ncbi:MAG: inositol monophosphatase family protein [Planctomycetota bacterium]|jgi:myo-inositol-1(or 4)-monophosphatase